MSTSPVNDALRQALEAGPWPAAWATWLWADSETHRVAQRPLADVYGHDESSLDELVTAWALHPALCGIPNGIAAFHRLTLTSFSLSAADMADWALSRDARRVLHPLTIGDRLRAAVRDAVDSATAFRLVGYHAYDASMGLLARWAHDILVGSGLPFALDVIDLPSNNPRHLSELLAQRWPMATRDADTLAIVNFFAAPALTPLIAVRPRHLAVLWAWELEAIPPLATHVAQQWGVDTLFALSPWSAAAFRHAVSSSVEVLALTNPAYLDVPTDETASSDETPYVLSILDARSRLGRKNPDGLLSVWASVADEFPNHRLVLKTMALDNEAPAQLWDRLAASPRTTVIDQHLSDEEYRVLISGAAAYLTLPRSEGLGLTPLEAAVHGVPVVYSDYSGLHDNFAGHFFPVPVTMVRVGDSGYDNDPYDDEAQWGEPDLDIAAAQLRRALRQSREDAQRDADAIRAHLREDYERARRRLETLAAVAPSAAWLAQRDRLGERPLGQRLGRRGRRAAQRARPLVARAFRLLPASLRRRLRPVA